MCFLKTAAIYRKQSEATRFLHDGTEQRRARGSPCTITGALSLLIWSTQRWEKATDLHMKEMSILLSLQIMQRIIASWDTAQSSRCVSTKVPPQGSSPRVLLQQQLHFSIFWYFGPKVRINFCHRCKEQPPHFPE